MQIPETQERGLECRHSMFAASRRHLHGVP